MGNNTIIKLLFVITLIIGTFNMGYGEDEHPLLKETEHKFDRLGLDLKGDVFSVVTKKVNHRQEFGQDKITGEFTTDSIVFDQNGRIIFHYYNPEFEKDGGEYLRNREKYVYNGNDVLKINGDINNYYQTGETGRDSIRYQRKFDNQGRLIQETTFVNGESSSQVNFQYITGGYEVKYYPTLQSDATIYAKKNGVVKITATSVGKKIYPYDTYYLDKNEKIIKNIKYPRLMLGTSPYATKYYSYNSHGDVVKEELVWSSNGRRDNKTYSYEYDTQGNWISKMSKNGNEIEWLRREIVYKSPEEIILHFQQKAQEKLQFEEDLKAKGRKYTVLFNNEMRPKYIDALTNWHDIVSAWNKKPIDVENAMLFHINGDTYSFKFSDSSEINNVKFTTTDDNDSFFLSDDLRVVLIPRYDQYYGPQWYVARYRDNWMDILNKNDSIDWVSVYYKEYRYGENINEEKLDELWRKELLSTMPEIHVSPYNNNILINKLKNPYDNGFVSPNISNKINEKKTLTAYQERIDKEEAKKLCTFAYHAIEECSQMKGYYKMPRIFKGSDAVATIPYSGKPDYVVSENIDIEKLKDYEINGNEYTFIKKDKSIISNVSFNRIVRDLDYSYHNFGYLSDDKKCALIIYRNSRTEDFIYLIELESNEIKTINYIPYKKSKDFIMPQIQ